MISAFGVNHGVLISKYGRFYGTNRIAEAEFQAEKKTRAKKYQAAKKAKKPKLEVVS